MEILNIIMQNFFAFVVVISIIVFIHEGGHFMAARMCGVKVEAFSIGFGPELFGWNDKKGTRWKISAFPLGGYVKMFGDEGAASTPDRDKMKKLTPEEEKVAFHSKPLWQKSAIVFAGPLANFILAIVIFTGIFMYFGKVEIPAKIGAIVEKSAAEEVGLKVGDEITELNGQSISSFKEIADVVAIRPGEEMPITYIRDGVEYKTVITPKMIIAKTVFGTEEKLGQIGIAPMGGMNFDDKKKLGLFPALWEATIETYITCEKILTVIGQMITGKRSSQDLAGIITIAKVSGESFKVGIAGVLLLTAMISVNLGFFNLFPIPVLDGGHLMFYAIEAVSGKPLAEKVQDILFRIGFFLLMLLMLLATYNDLKRLNIFKDSDKHQQNNLEDDNESK